jgi:cytochrome P450
MMVKIMLRHTLNIGFGRRMSWVDDEGVPPNHQMTFKDAIQEVSTNLPTKLMVPDWAMGFTKRTRKVRLAFEELDGYLLEMISNRRNAEKKEERYDLLSSLLDASADDPTFTDRELIGNIFLFLIAGHETTAHTLCFALGLLALYPDQQEILFQHIQSVLPNGRLPMYEDMPRLTHSMAVFYEALRMFPPVKCTRLFQCFIFLTISTRRTVWSSSVPKTQASESATLLERATFYLFLAILPLQ